jgi:hydrogenase maturation protease
MSEKLPKILVIGYGNPGRLDDGIGPAAADAMDKISLDNVTVDADYQLTVEDAAAVAEHDAVIFVDAAVRGSEPFYFKRIEPRSALKFSSHSVDPAAVLGLAYDLFNAKTAAYVMGIRGYEFNEFGETLSEGALANLASALTFLQTICREGDFREIGEAPEINELLETTTSKGN